MKRNKLKLVIIVVGLLLPVLMGFGQTYPRIDSSFNFGFGINYGFNYGPGASSSISGAAQILNAVPLSNGQIVISGGFTDYNFIQRSGIALLNHNGSLDTTFHPPSDMRTVYATVEQPDGKLIVGGNFAHAWNLPIPDGIARLSRNGKIDPTFNCDSLEGRFGGGTVTDLLLLPDGRIVLSGAFNKYKGRSVNGILRLKSDGSYDTTFKPGNGINMNSNDRIEKMYLQSDGKIVIVGGFSKYDQTNRNGIARLNANGTIDSTFNPASGINVSSFESISWISGYPNGEFLICGNFKYYNRHRFNGIARIKANGLADTTFNSGNPGADDQIHSSVIMPNGKIVIVGQFSKYNNFQQNKIIRLHPSGKPDTTFKVWNPTFSGYSFARIIKEDINSLFVLGDFSEYNRRKAIYMARIDTNGQQRYNFNPEVGPNSDGTPMVAKILPNRKIIVTGLISKYNGIPVGVLVMLNRDGSLDTSFKVSNNLIQGSKNVLLQPDGKFIVHGLDWRHSINTQEVLIRLNPNGEQDTTFSKVKLNVGNNLGTINSFLLQPDGKIVIGGTFSDINNRQFSKLARILPNGEIDSAFKPKPDREVRSVKLQTDGKILVGGLFRFINRDTVNGMARLQSSGLLDSTFKLPGVPEQKEIMAIDIQADGKIIVCGSRNSVKGGTWGYIDRLHFNGSSDTSFHSGKNLDSFVDKVLIQPDGKIIFGGNFNSYYFYNQSNINAANFARLFPNGKLDESFFTIKNNIGKVQSMELDSNGNLLLLGNSRVWNNYILPGIFRLIPGNGTISGIEPNLFGTIATDLVLYPNPVADALNLDISTDKPLPYTITNPLGQVVAVGNISHNHFTINTNSLPNGLYLLQVEGIKASRFIKQGNQ